MWIVGLLLNLSNHILKLACSGRHSYTASWSSCRSDRRHRLLGCYFLILLLFGWLDFGQTSLIIGALFQNDSHINANNLISASGSHNAGTGGGGGRFSSGSSSLDLSQEFVFKFAVYYSNQVKYVNATLGGAIGGGSLAPRHQLPLANRIINVFKSNYLKSLKNICKDLNGNMIALIGPNQQSFRQYIQSLSEDLDLVHLDIEPSSEPSYSFNLYPSTDTLCRMFGDLIKRFQWKHAAIIYDSRTNLRKVRCLLESPGNLMPKLDIALRFAEHELEYRSILRDIGTRRFKNIILDLEPEEAQVMLKMALQLGMINSTYHYVLTTLDIETIDLDDFKYNRANITGLRLVKTESAFYKSLMLNISQFGSMSSSLMTGKRPVASNLDSAFDRHKVFLRTKNALMFDAVYLMSSVIRDAERTMNLNEAKLSCVDNKPLVNGIMLSTHVEKASVNGLTGLISFQNKQRKEFELDVLQLKETGLFKCGAWSNEHGLNFTFYDEIYEEDGSTLKKGTLRVVTLVEEPYVMEKDGKLQGFCIDILDQISQKMGFRYEIYKVPDNMYGSEDENGTWNGMIRELMDKKADLAISALTINFRRQQVVDFTKPFLSLGISILYKIPTSKKPGLFSFLNPLSLEIWIYTLIAYVLVSLVMMVLARFSPYEWRKVNTCNMEDAQYVKNQFTVWNSLWFSMGTLMQQGSDINPKALSTRVVGGVWWFFTLIIISSYTANLAAFLTVEKVDLTITNVEDLANQTKIVYGAFRGGSTMNFFKESRISTYNRMWKYMQQNPDLTFVTSNSEGVKRVLRGDYAFLMESPLIDYEIQRDCNLTQIGGLLDSKGYGIATQLGSPYTDDISLRILEMQEKGEIQKFYNRWWKGSSTCKDEKKESKANELKVENVGGIFVVLFGGVIIAMAVSLIEFVYYAKRNPKHVHKPLHKHMFDELRFASKCGASATKNLFTTHHHHPQKKHSNKSRVESHEYISASAAGRPSSSTTNSKRQLVHTTSFYADQVITNPKHSMTSSLKKPVKLSQSQLSGISQHRQDEDAASVASSRTSSDTATHPTSGQAELRRSSSLVNISPKRVIVIKKKKSKVEDKNLSCTPPPVAAAQQHVSIKPSHHHHHHSHHKHHHHHEPAKVVGVKIQCAKCQELIRGQLLDQITSDNAIVCKHDSGQNISFVNPGLLIVEQETAKNAQQNVVGASRHHYHSHRGGSGAQSSSQRPSNAVTTETTISKKQRSRNKVKESEVKSRSHSATRDLSAGAIGKPIGMQNQIPSAERLKNHAQLETDDGSLVWPKSSSKSSSRTPPPLTSSSYHYHHQPTQQHYHSYRPPHQSSNKQQYQQRDEDYRQTTREIPISFKPSTMTNSSESVNRDRTTTGPGQMFDERQLIAYDRFVSKSNVVTKRSPANRH